MEQSLKILMLSSDRNILVSGSAVAERMKEYGGLVGELHIILMSDSSHRLRDAQLDKNIWVYPTNSVTSLLRPIDAARIGKKLVLEKRFVRGQSLITCQDLESGWAGVRIKKRWGIPMELQLHTDINSPYFTGFQNRVRKFFAKGIIRNADSVRDVKTFPIYVDKEKIENTPIKFDLHARYPWHFIILMVCRLEPEKNIPLALRILSLVRRQYPDAGMVIAGSGSEEKKLKLEARSLKLEANVEFAGWQSDLASFYKTANAFIQTSRYEGYGLALVEAGLSGLPVITTPVGIANELEDGKDVYICNTEEEFAQRIIDLIENNQKRENLRFNLKKTLDNKLLSKTDYMAKIKANWEKVAKIIQ